MQCFFLNLLVPNGLAKVRRKLLLFLKWLVIMHLPLFFIDEIDAICSRRGGVHESEVSLRFKTEVHV